MVFVIPPKPSQQQQHSKVYNSVTSGLVKFKSILNLVIADLLRIIYIIILFAVVAGITFAGLSYERWYPKVSDYIGSIIITPQIYPADSPPTVPAQ